jgi:hypothetical protein
MAKGILVVAEMLKENPAAKKLDETGLGMIPKPELQRKEDIPQMGSPFESFYSQPGAMPPPKEASSRRRLNQF